MAAARIVWNRGRGYDLHVLKGETSPSLLDFLGIQEDDGTHHPATSPPADVASISFEPNFLSFVSPPTNGGVEVDTRTGAVTVLPSYPTDPRLHSFVIEAKVRTKPPVRDLGPIPIRVCVHESIEELWLTPSPLTIRRLADGLRFTVLARFDDETIGDITNRSGITWAASDSVDPGNPRIGVRRNGELFARESPASATITATHAGKSASATVEARDPWSTPVEAALLTSRSAGIARMADVPNLLFLSDGFDLFEKGQFEELVRKVVDELQKGASPLRPFDLFKGAVNYWMAFVPSRERGTSVLYDLDLVQRKTLAGREIRAPVRPAAGGNWSLENLIYHVGLPTPAEQSLSPGDARAKWLQLYGAVVALNVTDSLFERWRSLHDHRLANERDSAFGVSNGDRPKMHLPTAHRIPDFHRLRTRPTHLEPFLTNIVCRTRTGTPTIGTIWADPAGGAAAPMHPDLPGGLKVGQDRGRLCVLLGGTRTGGVLTDDAIFVSLRGETEVQLTRTAGAPQVDVVPYPLPSSPPIARVATIAHELAHAPAFGRLRDEYGEFAEPLRIPSTEIPELGRVGNLQAASDLATSDDDPTIDPGKIDRIRWLWPRIEAAGVLARQPLRLDSQTVRIRLQPGHAADFAAGDLVRLRRRPLVDHPASSVRVKIVEPGGVDLVGDTVTVSPLGPLSPADWPAGSVLIRPMRGAATPSDPAGQDLPLVAPTIRDHLASSGVSLNRAPPGTSACVEDRRVPQPAVNLPDGLPTGKPALTAEIVGLYDGGKRYFCGVYHPSGICLMRRSDNVYAFCPVCRYVMVDERDPTMHRVIHADYERLGYPEP